MAEQTKKIPLKDASMPKAQKSVASPSKKEAAPAAVPVQQPAPKPPVQPIPEKKAGETDDFAETIIKPVSDAWDFLKTGYLSLYVPLLKLNLVRTALCFLAIVLLVAAMAGLLYAFPGFAAESWMLTLGGMLILLIIGFALILWMAQTFESAAYLLVSQKIANKPYSMAGALRSASGPTLRYSFLDLGLLLLVMLPGLLLFLLPFGIQMGMGSSIFLLPGLVFAYIAFLVYYFFAKIIYEFIVQFWRYGFLFEGLGVVASLKRSYALVRSRLIETFIFNLVYLAVSVIVSIPSFVFGVVAYFVLIFVQMASLIAFGMWGYVVYFAVALLLSLIGIIFSTIMETACRPLHYLFWKGITERAKK